MKTILVIEDDEPSLAIYAMALTHAGHRILTAVDGGLGLKLAREHLPDLILCDINLPVLNGWQVLDAVRADARLNDVQFVFMTGHSRANPPREGMERGADDFLEKPFGVKALLACVEARLRRAGLSHRITDHALNELRATLHSTLPHEFFTPLAGIIGLADLLREDISNLSAAEVAEFLGQINQSALQLHRTLRNYLFALELNSTASASGSQPVPLTARRLQEVIEQGANAALRRHGREADWVARYEPVAASVSLTDLPLIVEELVDNACVYSRAGTPISLQLDAQGELVVRDEGRGMTPEQIGSLGAFRQFERKLHEQQGLGLGLYLVHHLAARGGLGLRIESSPGHGSSVRLQLPRLAS